MKRVFLDVEGNPNFESFRAGNHEETRPFLEVENSIDLDLYIIKSGELVLKTAADLQAEKEQKNLDAVYVSRKQEYGSIQSQLDEIYHDPEAWRARIRSIKNKHPKP